MKAADGKSLLAMLLILLLAFALGAASLNADIVWLDEMFSLGNMGAFEPPYNPQQVIDSLAEHSSEHVPLYFVLGAQWAQLVGWAQVAMRYLSLLFGVLLIACVYGFTAAMFNRRLALTAAFLVSTSAILLWYFHEIRMYTLLMFLTVAHAWLYFRLVSGFRASRWTWAVFVATASALIYTHVFALFFFFGLFIQHCLFVSKSYRWRAILLGWAFAALTFLPYLPILAADPITVPPHSRALSTTELLTSLADILVNDLPLLWLFIIALLGLTLRSGKAHNATILRLFTIATTVVVPLVFLTAIFQFIELTRLRYFLIVLPFILIVFAYFLEAVRRSRVIVALFLLLWLAGGWKSWRLAEAWTYGAHDWLRLDHPPPLHRYTDALQSKARAHDILLSSINPSVVTRHLKHGYTAIEYYIDTLLGIDGAFVSAKLTGDELREEYRKQVAASPYLLFAYEKNDKPANFDEVLALLQADYRACEVLADERGIFIERYVDKALTCDRAYAPIQYDNGITIIDKFADYDKEQKTVRVVTGWQVADEAQLHQYNVSLQILTPEWEKVGQAQDRHLYDDLLPWYRHELSTAGLPVGDYRLVVILHHRYSGKKVMGSDLETSQTGQFVTVLEFSIKE